MSDEAADPGPRPGVSSGGRRWIPAMSLIIRHVSVGQAHHAPAARGVAAELFLEELAVARHHHDVAPPRPEPVEREDRLAVGPASRPFELDDQNPLALEARVLDGRRRRADHAAELHGLTSGISGKILI